MDSGVTKGGGGETRDRGGVQKVPPGERVCDYA